MLLEQIAWVDDDKYLFGYNPLVYFVKSKCLLDKYCPQTGQDLLKIRKILTEEKKYEGIILDILMNNKGVYTNEESKYGCLTGLLLLRDIRNPSSINSETPITMYSIDDREDTVQIACEYGADFFISKVTNKVTPLQDKQMSELEKTFCFGF